jgi:hypothetical protein
MSSRPAIVQRCCAQLQTLLPEVRITRVRNLALLVLGLLWAETVSLPRIAAELPGSARDPSLERRLRRWLANPQVAVRTIWQALLPTLVAQLAGRKVILVFDPTPLTTRATVLMLGLVHGHRVLPLAWRTVQQQNEPWAIPQNVLMRELMAEVAATLPASCTVTLVVDRQMGGAGILEASQAVGWHVVARIKGAQRQPVYWRRGPDAPQQPVWDLITGPGQHWGGQGQIFPSAGWRDVGLTIWWDVGQAAPWVLISDRPGGQARAHEYARRVRCEATYQDCKSRVFQVEASKLTDLERLDRLLLGLHLAYWWAMRLGLTTIRHGQRRRYDRADRRDLSVVRLGLRRLKEDGLRGRVSLLLFACRAGHWFVPGFI